MWVVAGSPGMTGAAHLAARAAQRAGAGYVRLSTPGRRRRPGRPTEAVGVAAARRGLGRHGAGRRASGSGPSRSGRASGTGPETAAEVRRPRRTTRRSPVVVDGDALTALGPHRRRRAWPTGERAPTVLTPHDGELARLGGRRRRPRPHRRSPAPSPPARRGRAPKGPTTVVAAPGRRDAPRHHRRRPARHRRHRRRAHRRDRRAARPGRARRSRPRRPAPTSTVGPAP